MVRARWTRAFLAVALMAATLFAVGSLAGPGAADARCAGPGNEVTSTWTYGGVLRVREEPSNGTCNGNNHYTGTVTDAATDGRCVTVQYSDAGHSWTRASGLVCSAAGYSWSDLNQNSNANIRLCAEGIGCGWGSTEGGYGTNHGY